MFSCSKQPEEDKRPDQREEELRVHNDCKMAQCFLVESTAFLKQSLTKGEDVRKQGAGIRKNQDNSWSSCDLSPRSPDLRSSCCFGLPVSDH